MTKKNLWLMVLVIALVLGMVVACGDPEEEEKPPVELTPTEKAELYAGTYECTGLDYGAPNTNVTETIVFSGDAFFVYDTIWDYNRMNYLDFTIEDWEEATTPTAYAEEYPNALKFIGKIKDADSVYLPSNGTTPGFVAGDKQTTECWMYLYFNDDEEDITFLRTPFSKEGVTEKTAPVQTKNVDRVYKFKSSNTTPPDPETATKP
jgi:hypothetical protein